MAVTNDDLATFLNAESIDSDRATLLLRLASDACADLLQLDTSTTYTLPQGCDSVILAAAARAYVNPAGESAQMAGLYQMSGSTGGLFFTSQERDRVLNSRGRSRAFSVNLIPGYPDAFFPDSSSSSSSSSSS